MLQESREIQLTPKSDCPGGGGLALLRLNRHAMQATSKIHFLSP